MSRKSKAFYTIAAVLSFTLAAICVLGALTVNRWCWLLAGCYLLITLYPIIKLYEDRNK